MGRVEVGAEKGSSGEERHKNRSENQKTELCANEEKKEERQGKSMRMTLRSHVSARKRKKVDVGAIYCHYCRTGNADGSYVLCENHPRCGVVFCYACLKANFGISPDTPGFDNWTCLVCKGLCDCERCKNKIKECHKLKNDVQGEAIGDTLIMKEWRQTACLRNEKVFKGPKKYSLTSTSQKPELKRKPAEISESSSEDFEEEPDDSHSYSDGSDYVPNAKPQQKDRRKNPSKKTGRVEYSSKQKLNSESFHQHHGEELKQNPRLNESTTCN